MSIYLKLFVSYCFFLLVVICRFLLEDSLLGFGSHLFLFFHQHYWYFLVILNVIFWSSVFLRKGFLEFYWVMYGSIVVFIPMIYILLTGSFIDLTYLNSEDFIENIKHALCFLLDHENDKPIGVELITVFLTILILSFVISKKFFRSLANSIVCYFTIICMGTLYISPFKTDSSVIVQTSMHVHMWMTFKYMSYVFVLIFIFFRHEIINLYKNDKHFSKQGFFLFVFTECIVVYLFGIKPFLQNQFFYFADIFVTLIPAFVFSQTLNLWIHTKANQMIFRKMFLSLQSSFMFLMVLFYFTGWYHYIGSNYYSPNNTDQEGSTEIDNYVFDTVIVGGGLAGLKAAYDLKDKGIQLLEKGERLGGRVFTERCGEDFCELGALFGFSEDLIPESFEKGTLIPQNKKVGIYLNQNLYENNDIYNAIRLINPKDIPFFDEYDQTKDIKRLLKLLSNDSKQLIRSSFNTIHPGNFDNYSDLRKQDAFRTFYFNQYVGGNYDLIEAYGKGINNRYILGAEVLSIDRKEGTVFVQYMQNGKIEEIKAKTVIVATPSDVARKIIKNMNKNSEQFLESIQYGKGVAAVFEVNNNNYNFSYIITPNNSFNTISFSNTLNRKKEIIGVYFMDSFVSSNPQLNEQDYIKIAKDELYKIGIFNEKTEIFYEKAKYWEKLGTIITEDYCNNLKETLLNPIEGVYLAGDYTFCGQDYSPYGMEAAFYSGEVAAKKVRQYLNDTKQDRIRKDYAINKEDLSDSNNMFDLREDLTVCSRYKINNDRPEFFDILHEANIVFYALIAQATGDRRLAEKVAATMTKDFEWQYHDGYKASAFDSSIVLESLIELNLEKDKIRKSLNTLEKNYYKSGCFYNWTLFGSIGSSTYWTGCSADITAHLGWIFYKFDPDKYVKLAKNCAEYVKKSIDSQSFASKWFPSNILVPYYSARLLKIFEYEYQKELDIISDFLISKQQENGSFYDSVMETSYAVLTMKSIENKELLPNIEKAESWLRNNKNHFPEPILYYWIDSQAKDGEKIFFSCYDKGLISEAYKKMALEK